MISSSTILFLNSLTFANRSIDWMLEVCNFRVPTDFPLFSLSAYTQHQMASVVSEVLSSPSLSHHPHSAVQCASSLGVCEAVLNILNSINCIANILANSNVQII